ncbi:fatty acid synthase-like isoform X1 [Colias croceus]|uniref:fatty acid synthase-like isoform X1 n=1 Tax=Colias crocea TaxID=72248 RepID=UPI001E27CA3D|nr:fatty acid synthase-like isoform X1 [Colias croceus]
MAPKPQEFPQKEEEAVGRAAGDRIVISGMSGLYPESHNIKELSDILYNKVNPVTAENLRWQYNHPEVSDFTGKVPDLELFDAQFFKVHYRLAMSMDSMSRKVLEQSYQAIYDAGVNPEDLSGKKVGVYLGCCFSETEKACVYVTHIVAGFGIAGCSRAMFANRISYWLNSKGPSMVVDQACCSSTVALELAFQAINRGDCDAALVGGSSLCLHPHSSIHYGRIMTFSMDGKTQSFDQNGCGCAKSDTINVLFLQKAKEAVRVYAEIVHAKCEFTSFVEGEDGPRYGFYRNPSDVVGFMKEFYSEANVSPQAVEYVEAFGSGVPEADKAELEAIDEVFCSGRTEPLPIGSVMSNIGYSEAATGVSSITKVLLGFERGEFAANLNYDTPHQDVAAIRSGRIRVISDHTPTQHGYVAVNSFSVTGVNAHVLLKGHFKPKDLNRYKSNIPRLVTISARQDTSIPKIFADLKSRSIDPEELALFHNIHKTNIPGHLGRGYIILDTNEANETVSLVEKSDYCDITSRPLWFVYSGMGSQWPGMGKQLMRIPVFAAAIEKCQRALEPKGIDLINIITSPDKKMFDNILHSFVGIAAVQIGLTDVLFSLGIVPDKIIGHSVGELGCAYADGCLTAEEMILSAYSRGLVSVQTPFIKGSMAAVGIGYAEIVKLLPPDIEVACRNSRESCTISGPAESMSQFVGELSAKGVFAREVPCSNIAYHSRYIADAGPGLLKYLSEVIPNPKARSERWISSSVPESRWNEPLAQYSSAEYHTNNLLNPVLFEEASAHIPADAVLVELAPHGLLQAILKRALPDTCANIPLTRRGHDDNARFLLEAVGQLYMEGFTPRVSALYGAVQFPVSSGTPMLAHHVQWAHHETWPLPLFATENRKTAASCKFVVSIHDDEHSYLQGHVIKDRTTYPYAAALVSVWDTLAMTLGCTRRAISVQFHDVRFTAQPRLHAQRALRMHITLQRGTGRFEVLSENTEIATGFIEQNNEPQPPMEVENEAFDLTSEDIYKLLSTKDCAYTGEFQSIKNANIDISHAKIYWRNNWVTLIDSLIQMNILKQNGRCELEFIREINVNVGEIKAVKVDDSEEIVDATVSDVYQTSRCPGVIMKNIRFRSLPLSKDPIALKEHKFVPHFPKETYSEASAITVFLQIVAENLNKDTINVLVVKDGTIFNDLKNIVKDIPGLEVNLSSIHKNQILQRKDTIENQADVLLLENLSLDENLCQLFHQILPRDYFIINKEQQSKQRPLTLYTPVSAQNIPEARIELVRWRPTPSGKISSAVTVHSSEDLSLLASTLALLSPGQNLLIISTFPKVTGLVELVKEWRKETRSQDKKIFLVEFNHKVSNDQCLNGLPELNLMFNVYNHGIWGGKYYLPIEKYSQSTKDVMLTTTRVGDINALSWVEAPELYGPGMDVKVHYATLNTLDAKRCTGVVPINSDVLSFGMDFSGVTDSGVRVMGLVSGGSARSRVRAPRKQVWPVPAHWTLEDAATVPLAYTLAFYCLTNKVQLRRGMRILVHGGTGALAQAAISIALACDCEVFTTVSDVKKKQFVRKLFPQLPEDHIGNSRDHTFADMVLSLTNGKGCDIVISGLSNEFKNTSIRCLGEYGIMYDTSLLHDRDNFILGMNSFTKCRSFATLDLAGVLADEHEMKRLQVLVSEGIARGYVRPLSRVVVGGSEAARALRLLAAARQRGRVLLDLQPPLLHVHTRVQYSAESSHIILSDDATCAIQLADRLAERGARNLYIQTEASRMFHVKQRIWKEMGIQTVYDTNGLWNKNYIDTIINKSVVLGSIENIYVIVTKEQTNADFTTYMDKLDVIVKKHGLSVKNVVVLDVNGSFGDDAFTSGSNITVIKMAGNNQNENRVSFLTGLSALDGLPGSIKASGARNLEVHRVKPRSMLQEIANIANIELPKNVMNTATLKDLSVDTVKLLPVRAFLRDEYHIFLEENEISELTVKRIKEIEESVSDVTFKELRGFANFYSYVDTDELRGTTEMAFLSTLIKPVTMEDDEFDVNQKFICVVPGVEGHHSRFTTACERLKLPALALQPGLQWDTIEDMAARFAKVLLKRTGLKGNFYLMGYESGVIVALEMARILEEHGLTGTVFCVGGTPKEIVAEVKEKLKHFKSDEELQDNVALHMTKLILGDKFDGHLDFINNTSTWEEKLDGYVRYLSGLVPLSTQYIRGIIHGAYSRVKQIQDIQIQPHALKSQVIFLRAKLSANINDLPQDYSQVPVVLYELSAPLADAARDLRCSAIVNRHLDEETLKAFEDTNICETYSLNVYELI